MTAIKKRYAILTLFDNLHSDCEKDANYKRTVDCMNLFIDIRIARTLEKENTCGRPTFESSKQVDL